MQPVSNSYKPYADARKSLIRVKFALVDVRAAGDTQPEPSEQNAAAQTAQIIKEAEGMEKKWGTLEKNHFFLDGSFSFFPKDPEKHQVGWWSKQQSDKNGNLSPYPTLTFRFTETHSSVGFTVIFDDLADQYCTDFTIQTYSANGNLLTKADVRNNTQANRAVVLKTDNYTKVVFTFRKTNQPLRFARVSQILFGIVERHDNSTIPSADLLYEISPIMESAPANEFIVSFLNSDRRYNLINPNGQYRYLQQGQPLDVELSAMPKDSPPEYVNMGRFYFTSSKATDDSQTVQITAHSPFYAMDKTVYRRGRRGTTKVKDFITELFQDAGFPLTVQSLEGVGERLVRTECDIVSHRKAVQLAAQAACCICVINRNNEVVLMPPQISTSVDTLTLDNQMQMPAIDVPERINTITLKARRFIQGERPDTIHESTEYISGTKTMWFDYDAAADDVSAAVSGGTLEKAEYYLNSARLTITSSGNVTITLTGTPCNRKDAQATVQRLDNREIEQIKNIDNPLVLAGNERQVANWVLSFKRDIYIYSISDRGNPAREICDTVRVFDAYGEHRPALANKIQLKFDGTLSGSMGAIGILGGD